MTSTFESERDLAVLRRRATGLIIVGLLGLVVGALFSTERAWGNLLLISCLLSGFGVGGAFFLAFHGATGARWSVPLLPAARVLVGTLPLSGLVAGVVAIAGLLYYPWARGPVAHGETFWFKNAWLSSGFFIGRTVVYALIWTIVARWLCRPRSTPCAGRSGLAIVLLALSLSGAGFDWIMSLEPLWFSTMFGVYQFSSVFLSGLAALVLLAAWRKYCESDQTVGQDQLHDMGKMLFGFSSFWMYIWFSQYMLIWYVNLSEEIPYFISRMSGLWQPVSLLNLGLNWVIPFFVLAPRPAKRNWRVMVYVCVALVVGRWLDLYVMILPPLSSDYPPCGFAELGGLLLGAGIILRYLTTDQVTAVLTREQPCGEPGVAV